MYQYKILHSLITPSLLRSGEKHLGRGPHEAIEGDDVGLDLLLLQGSEGPFSSLIYHDLPILR